MKEVKVIIKDKNTLVLLEDAQKDDYINLSSLQEVDLSMINKLFDEGKERIYQERINKIQENNEIVLKHEKDGFKNQLDKALIQKEAELDKKYSEQIKKLETEVKTISLENDLKFSKEKMSLNEQIIQLKNQLALQTKEAQMALKEELFKLEEKYNAEIKEKEEEIRKLNFQKSYRNIKQIGENLEKWCDGEVTTYLQNGFYNCVWSKDNASIKEEDDTKGSKADYLFKIYAENEKINLLTSICLEMKDEDPKSVNKKKNADYYKQLDKNRLKKNCEYAILVSNLELDHPNLAPIFKVLEYPNMYVVRPSYLMTFLNMLVSLTEHFKNVLLKSQMEEQNFKASLDLIEEFNKLKANYLDKPLELLNKDIEKIKKSSEDIKKASNAIDEACNRIIEKYINDIENKLKKFNILKITNNLEKLNK